MAPRTTSSITTLAALASLALTLAACGPLRVNSYAERGVDFQSYDTYAWGPADALSTGDPRLDNNEFFDHQMRRSVEREMGLRNFEQVTADTADLLVHYHASISQEIITAKIDWSSDYCSDGDCQPAVYEIGTLLVDLVDARTRQLVWRGWVDADLDGVIDQQDLLNARIDAAVARIIKMLPGHA